MRTTRPRVQHNTKAACCTTSISVFDSILSVHHTQVPVPTYMMSPNPLRHGGFNTDELMMPSTVSTCTPLSIRHIRRWEKDEKLSRQHGCSPSPSGKTDRMYQAAQRYFGLFPAAVPCRARRSYCSHELQHAGTNAFSPFQPNELCLGENLYQPPSHPPVLGAATDCCRRQVCVAFFVAVAFSRKDGCSVWKHHPSTHRPSYHTVNSLDHFPIMSSKGPL